MPVNCRILYLLTIVAIHNNNTLGLIGHEREVIYSLPHFITQYYL